jgi:hypothetical protein
MALIASIGYKIYEMRYYLALSLILSMTAIPVSNFFVIERDRNRNELFGEMYWRYGWKVYEKTDLELIAEAPPEWGFTEEHYALPRYLNVSYEYPVFGLIFFAMVVWIFPGAGGLQPLWINFVLVLVFNLNLVLVSILLGDKIYNKQWARLFFAGYYIYGLILSAGGGKLEPVVDCLFLMALILRKEGQKGKAMAALGIAVQTKIYPGVAFPLFFLESPLASIWFFASTLLTVIPFTFLGASFDSLLSHFLNTSSYSTYVVNPLFPGLLISPDTTNNSGTTYVWFPALIPLVIYLGFMLYTLPLYLPQKQVFLDSSWRKRIDLLKPLYVYLLPAILFVFRWVMPWYLFWLGIAIFLLDNDDQAIGYLKQVTIVGFLYAFGVMCNWPYFSSGPLPDFLLHFPKGLATLGGALLLIDVAIIAIIFWKLLLERKEQKEKLIREAEARGELIL